MQGWYQSHGDEGDPSVRGNLYGTSTRYVEAGADHYQTLRAQGVGHGSRPGTVMGEAIESNLIQWSVLRLF